MSYQPPRFEDILEEDLSDEEQDDSRLTNFIKRRWLVNYNKVRVKKPDYYRQREMIIQKAL